MVAGSWPKRLDILNGEWVSKGVGKLIIIMTSTLSQILVSEILFSHDTFHCPMTL